MEQEILNLNGTPEQNDTALKEIIKLFESGYTVEEVRSAVKEILGGDIDV